MVSPDEVGSVVVDPNLIRERLITDPSAITELSAYIGAHKSVYPDYAMGERVEESDDKSITIYNAALVAAKWAVELSVIAEDPEDGWNRSKLVPERVQYYLEEMDRVSADG